MNYGQADGDRWPAKGEEIFLELMERTAMFSLLICSFIFLSCVVYAESTYVDRCMCVVHVQGGGGRPLIDFVLEEKDEGFVHACTSD